MGGQNQQTENYRSFPANSPLFSGTDKNGDAKSGHIGANLGIVSSTNGQREFASSRWLSGMDSNSG